MNQETLKKLSNKIIGHFPKNEKTIAMFGSIYQEPYKSDLFEIFKEAYNFKNIEQSINFERFNEEVQNYIKLTAPEAYVHPEFGDKITNIMSMWNEWLYFAEKLRIKKI